MAKLNFDANEVEPNEYGNFEPLPPADYVCWIVASDVQPTKSGTGSFLLLELEVCAGPHKGRKLWDRLNIENPNQKAVQIARGTLSSICRAVGVMTPRDSSELHHHQLLVHVKQEMDPDRVLRNVIKGYKEIRKPVLNEPLPCKKPEAVVRTMKKDGGEIPF